MPTSRVLRGHAATLATVACLSAACGSGDDEAASSRVQPIVGGTVSAPGGWPNVVWLDVQCSGVAVHEHLVLYAAHCGTTAQRVYTGDEVDGALEHAVEFCSGHPDFKELGDGNDLAFCVLREPLDEVATVPPALGCERERVEPGAVAVMIGFGAGEDQPEAGTKREVAAPIATVDLEIEIGELGHGTCSGDSGGPAFLRMPGGSALEWRLLGVLSSGTTEGCGRGYYTDVGRFVPWLEEASQIDLSPCGDSAGAWQPNPSCMVPALDERGVPLAPAAELPSATCGAPSEPIADRVPPELTIAAALVRETKGEKQALIDVVASDEGSGVRTLVLEVLDAQKTILTTRVDELPPFHFDLLVPAQAQLVRVHASDFEANSTSAEEDLLAWSDLRPTGGCQVQHVRAPLTSSLIVLMGCAVLLLRRRRARRHADLA